MDAVQWWPGGGAYLASAALHSLGGGALASVARHPCQPQAQPTRDAPSGSSSDAGGNVQGSSSSTDTNERGPSATTAAAAHSVHQAFAAAWPTAAAAGQWLPVPSASFLAPFLSAPATFGLSIDGGNGVPATLCSSAPSLAALTQHHTHPEAKRPGALHGMATSLSATTLAPPGPPRPADATAPPGHAASALPVVMSAQPGSSPLMGGGAGALADAATHGTAPPVCAVAARGKEEAAAAAKARPAPGTDRASAGTGGPGTAEAPALAHDGAPATPPKPDPPPPSQRAVGSEGGQRPHGSTRLQGTSTSRLDGTTKAASLSVGAAAGVVNRSARSVSQPHLPHALGGPAQDAPSPAAPGAAGNGGLGADARRGAASLHALLEAAAAAAGAGAEAGRLEGDEEEGPRGVEEAGVGAESGEGDEAGALADTMDEGARKRLKRKQSNRESARRSRLKKQAEADALARATSALREDNGRLRAALGAAQDAVARLAHEKAALVAQVRGLGGVVAPELEWHVPPVHVRPAMGLGP